MGETVNVGVIVCVLVAELVAVFVALLVTVFVAVLVAVFVGVFVGPQDVEKAMLPLGPLAQKLLLLPVEAETIIFDIENPVVGTVRIVVTVIGATVVCCN